MALMLRGDVSSLERRGAQPFQVGGDWVRIPEVAAARLPRAGGQNPFGIGSKVRYQCADDSGGIFIGDVAGSKFHLYQL